MRLTVTRHAEGLGAIVEIARPGGAVERLPLAETVDHHILQSASAPGEPHEFDARRILTAGSTQEAVPFRMKEPTGHHH